MKRLVVLALLAGLVAAPAAFAHAVSTSFVSVDLPARDAPVGAPVSLRWDLSLQDLVWQVFIDANVDGVATWGEIEAAKPAITSAVLGQIAVERGGAACATRVRDYALTKRLEQNFLSIALEASCPKPGQVRVAGGFFMSGDASQRALLNATRGAQSFQGVITPDSAGWLEPEEVSAWRSFTRFVGEGVWHVLIGYDHIAFVLLLLLPSVLRPVDGRWQGQTRLPQVARDIATIVTAFTIAHSITLALAVTGTVTLPGKPIEVAIAASIAIAAAINLFPRLAGWRLALAFGFGFVHGFGFANALAEIDASGTTLLPLLAGFNIGVEIAQLSIVAVVLPLIYSARATRWYAGGLMPLGSCALGAAGLVWLVQRLQGA
ncbi:MAG TPA: HupE/UreJ family protein [Steroidobacteraceae bacterium]|nr:HupE/UreJ family protein [Steroidobacteraceae bacterium]